MTELLDQKRVHPGKSLARRLTQLKRPKSEIARLLGISRQTLYEILAEKQAITASVALRIARLTGTRAEMWLELQGAYDLVVARRQCGERLRQIPQLEAKW